MTSCQCYFWSFLVYPNCERVYLRLCGTHMWTMLYLLLLWLLIRPDLCSFRAQYKNSQRSSWSNLQTCLKRIPCRSTVQILQNAFSMVNPMTLSWNKLESSVGRSTDSHRQRFSLDHRQRDQKCLVGWLLSKCASCGRFRVVLQVSTASYGHGKRWCYQTHGSLWENQRRSKE